MITISTEITRDELAPSRDSASQVTFAGELDIRQTGVLDRGFELGEGAVDSAEPADQVSEVAGRVLVVTL